MSALRQQFDPEHITPETAFAQDTLRPQEVEGVLYADEYVALQGLVRVHNSDIIFTLRSPLHAVSESTAYLVPGYGGVKQSMDPIGVELARQGVPNVSYAPGRRSHTKRIDLFRPHDLHVDTIDAIAQALAENSLNIKNKIPNGPAFDPFRQAIITHSMGGIPGSDHAISNPGQVEYIAHLAAAGFGYPEILQLLTMLPKGIPGGLKHELIPFVKQQMRAGTAVHTAKAAAHYFGSNLMRTGGEGLSCILQDKREISMQLGALGIRRAYYSFQYDILVPPNDTVEEVVDTYEELPGMGHLAVQIKPDKIAKKIVGFATEPSTRLAEVG